MQAGLLKYRVRFHRSPPLHQHERFVCLLINSVIIIITIFISDDNIFQIDWRGMFPCFVFLMNRVKKNVI